MAILLIVFKISQHLAKINTAITLTTKSLLIVAKEAESQLIHFVISPYPKWIQGDK